MRFPRYPNPKDQNKAAVQVKWSNVSFVMPDTGNFPRTQVKYNGKASDMTVITPYGLWHNLPMDSLVLTMNVQGQEESKAGIGNTPKKRFKGLKEGEVVVGNALTLSSIKFDEQGNIYIECKNNEKVTITGNYDLTAGGEVNFTPGSRVKINGNLEVTGNITVFKGQPSEFTLGTFRTTYNSHTHPENDLGGPTDPPIQQI